MNLNGISSPINTIRLPQTQQAQVERDPAVAHPQPQVATQQQIQQAPQARPTQAVEPQQSAVPIEPPAGTDPELWSVLTNDERRFFAKAGAMGPLTYGHLLNSQRADAPVMRGGRLDVKA